MSKADGSHPLVSGGHLLHCFCIAITVNFIGKGSGRGEVWQQWKLGNHNRPFANQEKRLRRARPIPTALVMVGNPGNP